jgi:ferric-chelate reductase
MADTGTPPTIPIEFQQYKCVTSLKLLVSFTNDDPLSPFSSYLEDPKWQRKFSAIWASFVGAAILCALPHLVRSIKQGRAFTELSGIWEDFSRKHYKAIPYREKTVHRGLDGNRRLAAIIRSVGAILLWTPPGIELNAGQSAYDLVVLSML